MLRIHFTADDLARVRVASGPDPMWETLLSLHMLAGQGSAVMFGPWRQRVRPRLNPAVRLLTRLAPAKGYSADFLTPPGWSRDLESGIDAVLSTPRPRLRADLTMLAADRPLPGWVNPLADGDLDTLHQLGTAIRGYFDAALAPHWGLLDGQISADRARRARSMIDGGTELLLATLHPTMAWESPVLHVAYPYDRDFHLNGRGLLLIPSFFCWRMPVTVKSPDLPPTLVYPIEHDHGWDRHHVPRPATGRGLAALVGQTRAAVLRALAAHDQGCTTTELARHVSVSPSSASEHAATLRNAGLTVARHHGKRVLHTLTPLGRALLREGRGGPAPVPDRPV